MRRVRAWTAFLLAGGLFVSGPLAGAPKKPEVKDPDKTTEKMVKAGRLVGKVLAVNESKKGLKLEVTLAIPKLNQGALNALAQAQRNLAAARLNRDVQGMINAQNEIARQQANLYTIEKNKQEVEVESTDEAVVRTAVPKEQFDEKGRVKKLTAKERRELRGDGKLPGFKAEFDDIQQDQIVEVRLVKKKGAPRLPKRGKKGLDKEDLDLLADHLPRVSMIVILREAPAK
jgi:hypothetical protein